jgi:hypothetical protein
MPRTDGEQATPAQEGATHALHGQRASDAPDRRRAGNACAGGGHMLFDFTEAERNTARRALEIYVSELIDEIGKTERREWRESLRLEREILERVIEQLSV